MRNLAPWALAGCLAVFAICCFSPPVPIDLSKEQEPFRLMVLPLYRVSGPACGNYRGMAITVIDGKYETYKFVLEDVLPDRATLDSWDVTPNVSKELAVSSPPVVLKDSRRSRALLAYLVEKYDEHGGMGEVFWPYLIDKSSLRWREARWKIQRLFK